MSIAQTNIVDFISIDKDGHVVLTISDHLEWDSENKHLVLLQKKLNAYLRFIESGELLKEYPAALERNVVLSLVARCQPSKDAALFLERTKESLKIAGYHFQFAQRDLVLSPDEKMPE